MLTQDEQALLHLFRASGLPFPRVAEAFVMVDQWVKSETDFDPDDPGPPGQPMPALRVYPAA